jgi:hypothetical protein
MKLVVRQTVLVFTGDNSFSSGFNFIMLNYFQKTHKDRIRHLLDLLAKKNNSAFEHFIQALKMPYPWLSQQLEAEGPQSYQVEEKSFFDSLLLGGLPQSPPHNVERKEKVEYDSLYYIKVLFIAFACICGVNVDLHWGHVEER